MPFARGVALVLLFRGLLLACCGLRVWSAGFTSALVALGEIVVPVTKCDFFIYADILSCSCYIAKVVTDSDVLLMING